jgi:hypothetical protein
MSQMLDSFTAANGGRVVSLFDHIVGNGEQARRNDEAECFGGLEVDDQLEFGWLLHGQVGGPFALQDAPDVVASPTRPDRCFAMIDADFTQPTIKAW